MKLVGLRIFQLKRNFSRSKVKLKIEQNFYGNSLNDSGVAGSDA